MTQSVYIVSTNPPNQSVTLTKTVIDRLSIPSAGQCFLRDAQLKGFAVRVTPSGTKSFIVEKRVNGRVRRMTLGRFGELTVEQARKQAIKLLGQVATGTDPVAEKLKRQALSIALEQAYTDYIKAKQHSLSPKTLKDYRNVMSAVFTDWQGKRLNDITRAMVAKRHRDLSQNRGEAYANLAMRLLRAVLNFAQASYDDGQGNPILQANPVAILSQTRAWNRVQRRQTVLKAHQLPAWYGAVMGLRADAVSETVVSAADFLRLVLFTGLRKQEALTLEWNQVDLEDRTFRIPDPKNHQPLTLPLSDYLHAMLTERQREAVNGYVFPGRNGVGHLVEPKRQVAQVIEFSGVPFMIHDLRRTFITIAEGLDIPVYAIKRLVDHKMSGDVTAGYIISDVERLRRPMQQISDFILDAVGATLSHQD